MSFNLKKNFISVIPAPSYNALPILCKTRKLDFFFLRLQMPRT